MSNAELIAKIKADIKRRKNYISVTHFAEELLSFLSTLESEHLADVRKTSAKDIEEAGREYAFNNSEDGGEVVARCEGFVAGGVWQKEQMMEDAVEGYVERDCGGQLILGRENSPADDELMLLDSFLFPEIHAGEKYRVRIIIVKEENK